MPALSMKTWRTALALKIHVLELEAIGGLEAVQHDNAAAEMKMMPIRWKYCR